MGALMSRRTSEASKAIQVAWQKERELVIKGHGTRDWTPEQQEEIITLGKAYYHSEEPGDINDGKAFVGHHMKSVEAYPEFQGDPENIQFLSYTEHKEAHSGDFKNSTNGYFDPETKRTYDFGDEKYEPCKIIKLTNSIKNSINIEQGGSEKTERKNLNRKQNTFSDIIGNREQQASLEKPFFNIFPKENKKNFLELFKKKGHEYLGDKFKEAIFSMTASFILDLVSRVRRSSNYSDKIFGDENTDFRDKTADNGSLPGRNNSNKRLAPEKHTVSTHEQRYHTKKGTIIREKKSYQRGGKRSDII